MFARLDGSDVDPTAEPVSLAFPLVDQPPTVWYSGSWDDDDGTYFAQCLVGPGGAVELAIEEYDVYVKVDTSPEVPVLPGGKLQIY